MGRETWTDSFPCPKWPGWIGTEAGGKPIVFASPVWCSLLCAWQNLQEALSCLHRSLVTIPASRRLNSIINATQETNSLVSLFQKPRSAKWLWFIGNLLSDYRIIRLMLYLPFLLGKHSWKTKILKPWKVAIGRVQLLYFPKILKCRNVVNTFCIGNIYLADGL